MPLYDHPQRITNENTVDFGHLHGMGKGGVIAGEARKRCFAGLVLSQLVEADHEDGSLALPLRGVQKNIRAAESPMWRIARGEYHPVDVPVVKPTRHGPPP